MPKKRVDPTRTPKGLYVKAGNLSKKKETLASSARLKKDSKRNKFLLERTNLPKMVKTTVGTGIARRDKYRMKRNAGR